MRWTNMSEKEMIKAWTEEECTQECKQLYLPQPDLKKESYWQEYNNSGNIEEYDFSTVPELLNQLKVRLPEEYMSDLIRPLGIAAFKHREYINKGKTTKDDCVKGEDEITIPEFVYNF